MQDTMHSLESNSSNVPAFLIKLWKLVEDSSCDDLITWSANGLSFIIRDQNRISKELLPQYFKHNNFASFIRQLNMYGFHKVMNYEKSGPKNDIDEMEFQHNFFLRDQVELLVLIKRKIPNNKVAEPYVKSNAKDILTDLTSIREKQENMDNMLLKMKQENELLWRELTSMRQKHKAQEQIIQKVIQFLVSVLQRSDNRNIGAQRKITRMLQDSPGNKSNSQQILLRKNNNTDCIVGPDAASPLGPVIHEVTDLDESRAISPALLAKSPISNVRSTSSSLNSASDTSATVETLSILKPLQSRTPAITEDNSAEESILGIPFEYITNPSSSNVISIPSDKSIGDVISFPEGTQVLDITTTPNTNNSSDVDNVISMPECYDMADFDCLDLQPSASAVQNLLNYAGKTDFVEDLLSSASLQTPRVDIGDVDGVSVVNENSEPEMNSKQLLRDGLNYQLSLNDDSSLVKSSDLSRSHFSNYLHNMEENLSWLRGHMSSDSFKDHLGSNPWIYDDSKLLGLFSTDDILSDPLDEEMAASINGKNDIVGNEIVQFNPSMLDVETGDNAFFDYLNNPSKISSDFYPVNSLPSESEEAALVDGDNLLSCDVDLNNISPKRRKSSKSPKGKRSRTK